MTSKFKVGDLVTRHVSDGDLFTIKRITTKDCSTYEEYQNLNMLDESNFRYVLSRHSMKEVYFNSIVESKELRIVIIPDTHNWGAITYNANYGGYCITCKRCKYKAYFRGNSWEDLENCDERMMEDALS